MFKTPKLIPAPLKYWEEKSYMLAILENNDETWSKNVEEKIASIPNLVIKEATFNNMDGILYIKLTYEDEEYNVGLFGSTFNFPRSYLTDTLYVSDEELQKLVKANYALNICFKFTANIKKSYHLQLKLAVAIIPNLIGVVDESAEKFLPAKWVMMSAKTNILPNPSDIYNIHAVSGKNNEVWLHTHGLCRANITELEVLNSNYKNYYKHCNLISGLADYLIDSKNTSNVEKEGVFLGIFPDKTPIIATYRPWNIALEEYPKLKLGGAKNRKKFHNTNSSPIFLYRSDNTKELIKVTDYDNLWEGDCVLFINDEETNRMKALAIERFSYVINSFSDKDNYIVIKIGLLTDDKKDYEHIWFDLLEIKGERIKVRLNQEPYEVSNYHKNDELWFSINDITDWIIFTPDFSITPETVYFLDY